jgi:16S rRNA (guanine(527)-N(7))-methyltransferase RsmG
MEWRIREYLKLSDELISSLRLFHTELLRLNQRLPLISHYNDKDADLLHFYDSIKASEFIIKENPDMTEIYDFGPGNGLPGIVMAMLYPNITVNIVEGDSRKSYFLQHIIDRTELKNVFLMNINPDEINIKKPAILMSRGMANLGRTLILGSKVLKEGSIFYTLKGGNWFTELTALPAQISSTWNNEMAYEYELPESLGTRVIIKSIKIS